MDKNVEKLISGIQWLVGRRKLHMIDDALFLRLLFKELESFNISYQRVVESSPKEISSDQMRLIDKLVDNASGMWEMIPSDVVASLSYIDFYRMGFVKAVLCVMRILGIDEKRVKR